MGWAAWKMSHERQVCEFEFPRCSALTWTVQSLLPWTLWSILMDLTHAPLRARVACFFLQKQQWSWLNHPPERERAFGWHQLARLLEFKNEERAGLKWVCWRPHGKLRATPGAASGVEIRYVDTLTTSGHFCSFLFLCLKHNASPAKNSICSSNSCCTQFITHKYIF